MRGRYTSGRCCWMGQYWSSAEQRCTGVPFACPEGMMVRGEQCVERRGRMTRAELRGHMKSAPGALRACAHVEDGERFRGVLWTRFIARADGTIDAFEFADVSARDVRAHSALARCVEHVITTHEVPSSRFDIKLFSYPVVFDGRAP